MTLVCRNQESIHKSRSQVKILNHIKESCDHTCTCVCVCVCACVCVYVACVDMRASIDNNTLWCIPVLVPEFTFMNTCIH